MSQESRRVLVTGSAGFIGYHLCKDLLAAGFEVVGFDAMTDYYDVTLKQRRHQNLLQHQGFRATEGRLEDVDALGETFRIAKPDVVIHLAAQAGVRYSLETRVPTLKPICLAHLIFWNVQKRRSLRIF